jgi:hypothetical protein
MYGRGARITDARSAVIYLGNDINEFKCQVFLGDSS